MLLSEAIIPYAGTQGIRLYQTRPEVKAVLREAGIRYHEEYWANKDETVPNPWHVLIADDVMSLFFARNGKLFKIVFWMGWEGCLPNGIHTGLPLEEARRLDPQLWFDDWNEVWQSPAGYWLEDDLTTREVMSITVYIREVLDDDLFDACEW